jgi:hypothetical protein
MGLQFLQTCFNAEGPKGAHERFADSLVHPKDARSIRDHDNTVGYLIRVENRSTSCRAPDNIDPRL